MSLGNEEALIYKSGGSPTSQFDAVSIKIGAAVRICGV
jgi:hypothetical protein